MFDTPHDCSQKAAVFYFLYPPPLTGPGSTSNTEKESNSLRLKDRTKAQL